jgi:hypothetical protein
MSRSPVYATAGAQIGSQAKVRHRSIYGSIGNPVSPNITKKKMKLTFKQKLRNWLMDTNDETEHPEIVTDSFPSFDSDPLRINVYKASGGFVVETRKYDRRKDENISSMNIITDDKDLGVELGRIVTMETLR